MRRFSVLVVSLALVAWATAADEYLWDDGTTENALGLTAGGEIAWIHHFEVIGGDNVITGVSTCFGSPLFPGNSGISPGQDFSVYVWSDPNGDGDPIDAVLLNETIGQAAAGSIETDVLQLVGVGNVALPTTSFFIGASVDQGPGTFPAPMDETVNMHEAWVAGSGTMGGFDPHNLTGGIGLMKLEDIGFPANWLLRADAIPEPATLSLLGIGALALLRRR